MLLCASTVWAQYDTLRVGDQWALKAHNPRYRQMNVKMVQEIKRDTTDHWWRRLSVQTNTIDWALTVPNLTIGFDLGDPFVQNTPTLLVGMRNTFGMYRWYNQENSYDYQGVKVELRRHWVPKKYRQTSVGNEPPKAPGRFYAGVYGEYSWDNHFDGHNYKKTGFREQDMWVPYGPSYMAGMTWGYELRKRNYNHRIHMNWDFGVDFGVIYAPKMYYNFIPMVTDLRVALNFRHDRINFLYWKPDNREFVRNVNYNNEMRLHLNQCRELIDSIGGVTIYVTPVADGDSAFKEEITEEMVMKEIRKQLNFKGLKQGKRVMYETSTRFPITTLGEYHSLDYRFGMRPESKLDETYGTDTIAFSFPIRVRQHGYEEADSLMACFEEKVTQWRNEHGNTYPVIKRMHKDLEHIEGHVTKTDIIALFREITGIELKPEQITGIYYKSGQLQKVSEEEVNQRVKRNCYYSIGIKWHPQFELTGSEVSTRFVIDFEDLEQLQQELSRQRRNAGKR